VNRLKNLRCYLSGPIDLCPEGGAPWRKEITPLLTLRGVFVLDPLDKPIDVGLEKDDARVARKSLKENGKYEEFSSIVKKIRHVDLRMVDMCDFMVAFIDLTIPMCGTWEEIFGANRSKKPVLVFCKQGKKSIPDWLFGTLPHEMLFNDMGEVIQYLEEVDKSDFVEDYGRWLFFRFFS
jgi:nucleoside 2-deoxyribosyltransferase